MSGRTAWAVVPAYRESPEDLTAVLTVVEQAGLLSCVVVQDEEPGEALLRALAPASMVVLAGGPLGKGGAVKRAWSILGRTPTVVLDADLHGLRVSTVKALAAAAEAGAWARTIHDRAGRLGAVVPRLLETWGVDYPAALVEGGLLCQTSGYPEDLEDHVDVKALPDHYGFDLALALDLYASRGLFLRAHYAGPRVHRPGSRAHLERMTRENLNVVMERSHLWSE